MRSRQARVEPDLKAIGRVSIHFDSAGHAPFTVWIDGLRFVPRR
jgi:hypothetical protein